jgi:poly-beta-hydroxyalkanoate depolymerase
MEKIGQEKPVDWFKDKIVYKVKKTGAKFLVIKFGGY